jgi:hypothetical protein
LNWPSKIDAILQHHQVMTSDPSEVMQDSLNAVSVLSAMITPAVLISACATLIFSTSTRLARIVDRVRNLMASIETLLFDRQCRLSRGANPEFNRQLAIHTRRGKLIQNALTSFYLSLSLFVGATVTIGLRAAFKLFPLWIPNLMGIVGTLFLFYACVILIAETRLALRSVRSEMEFTLLLREKYEARRAQRQQGGDLNERSDDRLRWQQYRKWKEERTRRGRGDPRVPRPAEDRRRISRGWNQSAG